MRTMDLLVRTDRLDDAVAEELIAGEGGSIMVAVGTINAGTFYLALAVIIFCIWVSGTCIAGVDLHRRGLANPIAIVPSCLSTRALLFVLRRPLLYRVLCHVQVPVLLCAGARPESWGLRWAAAASFTAYACAETSVTRSHRDLPAMYALWALALYGDGPTAQGLVLGVGVHLLVSSGLSKLRLGGLEWAKPGTMRGVILRYLEHGGADGPLLRTLAEAATRSDAALAAFGGGALLFEVVLVPLGALLLPARLRPAVALGAIAMHVGIAALQSLAIGVAFLVNVPVYAYGFCAPFAPYSASGFPQAVAVAAASAAAVAGFGLLPEDFPCSPFALFPWNGDQWARLFEAYVNEDTRLVLHLRDAPPEAGAVVHGKTEAGSELGGDVSRPDVSRACAFDAWDQVFGETLAPRDFVSARLAATPLDQPAVCAALDAFLEAGTVVAIDSGAPLLACSFVRLKAGTTNVVGAVVADARGPKAAARSTPASPTPGVPGPPPN